METPAFTSRADAIVASLARSADPRHTVTAAYGVCDELVLPFPALARLKEELTLKPKTYGTKKTDDTFEVWHHAPPRIWVPRYYGLMKWGVPDGAADGRSVGAPMHADAVFVGTLKRERPPQTRIVAHIERVLCSPLGGAMLQVGCGTGKTVCALALAAKLGRRTMVLVNNQKTLEPQWVERINQFVPGARVGFLRQKKVQIEDVDIVVGSIQSLMKREYDQALLDTIGFVVVDECHHIGARCFAQCMRQLKARYTLGLSATPNRKDGLGKYVRWMLGPVVVSMPTDLSFMGVLQYVVADSAVREPRRKMAREMERVFMITALTKDYKRSAAALQVLADIMATNPRRTALVLSERVALVDYFAEWCRQKDDSWGAARIHGASPKEEQTRAIASARVIVATYAMANEALDIPRVDTLLLLSPPKGDMEQILGRAARIHDGKAVPLVLDFVDPVGQLEGGAWARHRWYKAHTAGAQRVECKVAQLAAREPAFMPRTLFQQFDAEFLSR